MRGIIFDLDGTVADTGLDFEAMRREMGIPSGEPLLEAIGRLPQDEAQRCWSILDKHERAGVARAQPMPGAAEFVADAKQRDLTVGLLTRNSRRAALEVLERLELKFDPVFARDDAPPKPDPAAIFQICESWGLPSREVAIIGDYRFDLEAGHRAGARAVLYTAGRAAREVSWSDQADFVLTSFHDAGKLWQWLAEPL